MKKLLILVTLVSAAPAFAESKAEIQTNPLALLAGAINLGAAFRMLPANSLSVGVAYVGPRVLDSGATGEGLSVGWTHWFSGQTFSSSWVIEPAITFAHARGKLFGLTASGDAAALSLGGGYNWGFGSGFQLGVGLTVGAMTTGDALAGINTKLGFAF